MTGRKRLFLVFALLAAASLFRFAQAMAASGIPSGDLPKPTDLFYVNDYADVLPQEVRDAILDASRSLHEQTGAQIVVLTMPSLNGRDIATYSLDTARAWGIGAKGKDNGVLIMLATEDREVRVEVGRGLEGCLNDAKVGRLLDEYAIPAFRKDDFAQGIELLYYAVLDTVRQEYGLERLSGAPIHEDQKTEFTWQVALGLVMIIVILGVCFGLSVWVLALVGGGVYYVALRLLDAFTQGDRARTYWPALKRTVNPFTWMKSLWQGGYRDEKGVWIKTKSSNSGDGGGRGGGGGGGGFSGGGAGRRF